MPKLSPVSHTKFIRFLEHVGCHYERHQGDHLVYKKSGLTRSIIFRRTGDIPIMHIKSNLRTLDISTKEFFKILDGLK